ncbi:Aste57867_18255 [Aphanomyces stellatus]|uniref:glucan endo-1,3-beta-D-glucosidase n=1 Tax=Aphanomyces stellatus TaxID=120398 RepID=A0A485LB09_9STRA|nr:hypothetical protein As57867_018193 [Aphanomyces stellatus]VFT94992.1 Aste57867_18255 [Aphanomyces stellatus]
MSCGAICRAVLACLVAAIATSGFRFPNVTHPLQDPFKLLHPDLHGTPFPTEAFWTNLVFEGGQVVVSYPYAIKVLNNQLHISYPFRVVTTKSIIEGFTSEWILDLGPIPIQIRRFDELSVTIVAPQSAGGSIILHLVRGSPYITLEFQGATPSLTSSVNVLSLTPSSEYTQAILGNWHKWLLFSSSPFKWTQSDQILTGPSNYTGIVRLALALHDIVKPVLTEHASVYPVSATISSAPATKNMLDFKFSWQTKTFNGSTTTPLLMLALPHHLHTFKPSQTLVPELLYMCMRGPMTGVLGSEWNMQENVTDVPWDYADQGILESPNTAAYNTTVAYIKAALTKDIDRYATFATDSYTFGKQLGREARLVLTAHRFNMSAEFATGLSKMQSQLAAWLTGPDGHRANQFVYDTSYGGLITSDGFKSKDADFGNGYYNDHHFHYGYFVYGLAVVRRFNASFVTEHQDAINYLLSDIGAPVGNVPTFLNNFPQRVLFPSARHKDWYCGHSYASGLFAASNGKSQESSSEAVNAYYALALFTSVDDERGYYDYTRLLLATEIRSTQLYWQMPANQTPMIYEPVFSDNKMVGVVSEMTVVYSTWFGDRADYIHGIQVIPVTPITAALLLPEYVAEERTVLDGLGVVANPTDVYSAVLLLDDAIVRPQEAWTSLQATEYNYDAGSSATNAMHWIASRPASLATVPTTTTEAPLCFGYPGCSIAGQFGKPLDCCGALPGCCPGDDACCKIDYDPTTTSEHICHDEPACGALGLLCCDSPDGCCKAAPNTTLLGCCQQVAGPVTTAVPPAVAATCHAQPKCAAAKLECCGTAAGCCTPTSSGQVLGCCDAVAASNASTTTPPPASSCHNEPQCGVLGLACCDAPDGCCTAPPDGSPKLGCCATPSASPRPVASKTTAPVHHVSVGDPSTSLTCFENPRCMTAGPNGAALACCLDANGPGCCPGMACCDAWWGPGGILHWSVGKILVAIVGAVALGGAIYCAVLYYRRKNYQSLDRDDRGYYCAIFMVLTMAVFFYLVVTA